MDKAVIPAGTRVSSVMYGKLEFIHEALDSGNPGMTTPRI
jgi:hypothetical protein